MDKYNYSISTLESCMKNNLHSVLNFIITVFATRIRCQIFIVWYILGITIACPASLTFIHTLHFDWLTFHFFLFLALLN